MKLIITLSLTLLFLGAYGQKSSVNYAGEIDFENKGIQENMAIFYNSTYKKIGSTVEVPSCGSNKSIEIRLDSMNVFSAETGYKYKKTNHKESASNMKTTFLYFSYNNQILKIGIPILYESKKYCLLYNYEMENLEWIEI